MGPKLFLTGGTGYIGGSVLHTIVTSHPEYDVTVLLRNVPTSFSDRYPNVKIVRGDFDSFDTLAQAASEADVVVRCGSSNHEASLDALIAGLLRRSTPGFLIHLSGTGIVSDYYVEDQLGRLNPKVWSDLHDVDTISSLPDYALHRNTEKILFDAIAEHGDKVNIAIMCPPGIYGKGLGPGKTKSAFVPCLVNEAKKYGRVFYYNEGANTSSWVHIQDLMQVYLRVIEAAAAGGEGATWGKEGYYFTGSQEVAHIDIVKAAGDILKKHGVIENPKPIQIDLKTLDGMLPHPRFPYLARYMFAANSRTRPERAKKLFGYSPSGPGLLESLEEDILVELESS
ncbi:NAD(P)-binding protein [Westerdykella ornata]|uniref:NAD(P)-binding protein n=1 Tax=Westerdykella ornata TaxID=318751 RepID=A0A6A6JQG1_WESOR|nr:NAD(P)-binding protein [Westerdykella ornata]KAF2278880.1 NAD(P)-binding protein [Westerdykella ornata]